MTDMKQTADDAVADHEDLRILEAQADALRREGRHAAADQVLAWRDLHALRLGRGPRRPDGE